MLESSPREEIQRIAKENFFPWKYPEGNPFCRRVGVVLQVQNLTYAWLELPCYHSHSKFQHVLHWAEVLLHRIETLYSLTLLQRFFLELNFATTFCSDRGCGWRKSFWGSVWFRSRLRVKTRVMLWFWFTQWVWLWVGHFFGGIPYPTFEGNLIWESSRSDRCGKDFSTDARSIPLKDNQILDILVKHAQNSSNSIHNQKTYHG